MTTGTSFETIHKQPVSDFDVAPNLDRDNVTEFDWQQMFDELDWLPGGGLNKAHEAIDRHANGPKRDKIAMIWEGKNGEREDYTFGDMKRETDKFANVLKSLGIETGDRVFTFMDRLPEQYIAVFGILKAGAIAGPLFSAFGPDPVKDRMEDSGAKVLVTQPDLRRKITHIIPELFDLQHIIIVNKDGRDPLPIDSQDLDYYEEMGKASANFTTVATSQYDYSIMHYTSGTTGKPKGAVHRHQAVVQQYATGKWALDLHEDDIYWCTADPGWVTGTSYGMLAPWTNGVTQLIFEGGFRASWWYEQIQKHKVTVWYTAPTAIRMLMKAGDQVPKRYDLSSLRFTASVGEPLNPEAVVWGKEAIGHAFHDNWWQTETGAIMCANYASTDIKPGSMGRPIPGIQLGVVDENFEPRSSGRGRQSRRPTGLALYVPYLLAEHRDVQLPLQEGLVHNRRYRQDGRGRLLLVRRTRRRRNQHRRTPCRPVRGRERAHRTRSRRRGRRHRQARPLSHGDSQGVRIAEGWIRRNPPAPPRDNAVRPDQALSRRRSTRDRLHPRTSQDALRQDNAPPPQGP